MPFDHEGFKKFFYENEMDKEGFTYITSKNHQGLEKFCSSYNGVSMDDKGNINENWSPIDALKNVVNGVKNTVNDVKDKVSNIGNTIKDGVKNGIEKAFEFIKKPIDTIVEIFHTIKEFILSLLEFIKMIKSTAKNLPQYIKCLKNRAEYLADFTIVNRHKILLTVLLGVIIFAAVIYLIYALFVIYIPNLLMLRKVMNDELQGAAQTLVNGMSENMNTTPALTLLTRALVYSAQKRN